MSTYQLHVIACNLDLSRVGMNWNLRCHSTNCCFFFKICPHPWILGGWILPKSEVTQQTTPHRVSISLYCMLINSDRAHWLCVDCCAEWAPFFISLSCNHSYSSKVWDCFWKDNYLLIYPSTLFLQCLIVLAKLKKWSLFFFLIHQYMGESCIPTPHQFIWKGWFPHRL